MNPLFLETVFDLHGCSEALPDRFVIITAWATTGETWSPARNAAADEALRQELVQAKCWHVRCTGCSPDLKHLEPGWAAELAESVALGLGRKYLQEAIFLVRLGQLFVASCSPPYEEVPVAVFSDRVVR